MVIAATGFFDGVHIGHRAILSTLCRQAERERAKSVVITFWPHPRTVLQSDAAKFRLINSFEEKKELILDCGVDQIHSLSFSRELSMMSAKAFFTDCLQSQYGVTQLVAGYNHRVGHIHEHNVIELESVAKETGMGLIRVKEALCDGKVVSSSKIRETILNGAMEQANRWLGYQYSLVGVVVEGLRLGRSMGFPTANLQLYEPLKQLPADGVYAAEVSVLGKRYQGMMNIGVRPTVGHGLNRTIETHIFDFEDDIYGLPMAVMPLQRLRRELGFESLEALKLQLTTDREQSISWFQQNY